MRSNVRSRRTERDGPSVVTPRILKRRQINWRAAAYNFETPRPGESLRVATGDGKEESIRSAMLAMYEDFTAGDERERGRLALGPCLSDADGLGHRPFRRVDFCWPGVRVFRGNGAA